jgi:hypothetical protein
MDSVTHVVGVDPGLVHTGVVRLVFRPTKRHIEITHLAVPGPRAIAVRDWAMDTRGIGVRPTIFIEGYQPRHHYGSDPMMIAAVNDMRKATGGTVVNNTGVKKVVRRDLMGLLGVWTFGTVTHHQDLRAAARIALLGMLKDPRLNELVADVVRDHLAGDSWYVHS